MEKSPQPKPGEQKASDQQAQVSQSETEGFADFLKFLDTAADAEVLFAQMNEKTFDRGDIIKKLLADAEEKLAAKAAEQADEK